MLNWRKTTACTSQSTTAEKKSGDTGGISGDAGLRLGAVRGLRNLVKEKLTNSALFRAQ